MGGIWLHHSGHAGVEDADGDEDANTPTEPRGDILDAVQQSDKIKGTKGKGDGGEGLSEGMPPMKGFADALDHLRADEDHDKRQEEVNCFEHDSFIK